MLMFFLFGALRNDMLPAETASMDNSLETNMENLVKVGKKLLDEPISRVNLDTGRYEKYLEGGTNEEDLIRFAKLLSEERSRCLQPNWFMFIEHSNSCWSFNFYVVSL